MDIDFSQLASDESIATAKQALEASGFAVIVAETNEQAKTQALSLIPDGSEVMNMTSVTLDELGISKEINESGKFDSVRNQLNKMDRATQSGEMQKLGAAPEYAIGSVHAITEDGHVLIASNTGSQLPAYAYGASHVIWVASTKKIVPDVETGKKRIYEYVLPLESERARKAYGALGSAVRKLLLIDTEGQADRITIILVKQVLGF